MAPAMFIAMQADYVDLDAPTMLSQDVQPALSYHHGVIENLPSKLWGGIS